MEGGRIIEALKKLGLTEYEARAYVAVVELGEAEAADIARRSGVPRTRIYDVLSRLEGAGLIQRIKESRPAVYSAISPERSLIPLKNQLMAELSDAIDALSKIYLSWRSASRCEVSLLRGMQAYRASLRLLDEARGEVLIRLVSLPGDVFDELVDRLKRARERGIRVYLEVDVKLLGGMIPPERIEEVLEEFRGRSFNTSIPFNFLIADFENALLLYTPPDSPENSYGFLVHGIGEVGRLIREKFIKDVW